MSNLFGKCTLLKAVVFDALLTLPLHHPAARKEKNIYLDDPEMLAGDKISATTRGHYAAVLETYGITPGNIPRDFVKNALAHGRNCLNTRAAASGDGDTNAAKINELMHANEPGIKFALAQVPLLAAVGHEHRFIGMIMRLNSALLKGTKIRRRYSDVEYLVAPWVAFVVEHLARHRRDPMNGGVKRVRISNKRSLLAPANAEQANDDNTNDDTSNSNDNNQNSNSQGSGSGSGDGGDPGFGAMVSHGLEYALDHWVTVTGPWIITWTLYGARMYFDCMSFAV